MGELNYRSHDVRKKRLCSASIHVNGNQETELPCVTLGKPISSADLDNHEWFFFSCVHFVGRVQWGDVTLHYSQIAQIDMHVCVHVYECVCEWSLWRACQDGLEVSANRDSALFRRLT